MIISRITDLDLRGSMVHHHTDWEWATDLLFTDLIHHSYDDEVNKTSIVLDIQLDPDIIYYGRARVALSTGVTEWANIDVYSVQDIDDVVAEIDYPSIVGVPVLTTDSDASSHSPTLFNINVTGYGCLGDSDHYATTYIIEDLNGSLIWSSRKDKINKEQISITDLLLNDDSVYLIKAMFHSTSGDTSQLVTHMIKTSKADPRIVMKSGLNNFNVTEENVLEIGNINVLLNVKWEIISIVNGYTEIAYSHTTSSGDIMRTVLPTNTLKENRVYLLSIEPTLTDETLNKKYITFNTY